MRKAQNMSEFMSENVCQEVDIGGLQCQLVDDQFTPRGLREESPSIDIRPAIVWLKAVLYRKRGFFITLDSLKENADIFPHCSCFCNFIRHQRCPSRAFKSFGAYGIFQHRAFLPASCVTFPSYAHFPLCIFLGNTHAVAMGYIFWDTKSSRLLRIESI